MSLELINITLQNMSSVTLDKCSLGENHYLYECLVKESGISYHVSLNKFTFIGIAFFLIAWLSEFLINKLKYEHILKWYRFLRIKTKLNFKEFNLSFYNLEIDNFQTLEYMKIYIKMKIYEASFEMIFLYNYFCHFGE